MGGGAAYRLRQAWLAWRAQPTSDELALAEGVLGPALYRLFLRMQPSEQAHSLAVLRKLDGPEVANELRQAALLHDVGKCLYPLQLWQRAWIVICKKLAPAAARRWGQTGAELRRLPWWQQPLAAAEQHPAWGAQLAEDCGAAELVVNLIAAHQLPAGEYSPGLAQDWLRRLQAADDSS